MRQEPADGFTHATYELSLHHPTFPTCWFSLAVDRIGPLHSKLSPAAGPGVCKWRTKKPVSGYNDLTVNPIEKFVKSNKFSENPEKSIASPAMLLQQKLEGRLRMPNQKQRRKKDGENKAKKVKAMRIKEAQAKPAPKPSATGKAPGQTSKFEKLQDRPGALRRA